MGTLLDLNNPSWGPDAAWLPGGPAWVWWTGAGLAAAVGLGIWIRAALRVLLASRRERCRWCGYDVSGDQESDVCAECGCRPRANPAVPVLLRVARASWAAVPLMLLGAAICVVPRVQSRGLVSLVPTSMLIAHLPELTEDRSDWLGWKTSWKGAPVDELLSRGRNWDSHRWSAVIERARCIRLYDDPRADGLCYLYLDLPRELDQALLRVTRIEGLDHPLASLGPDDEWVPYYTKDGIVDANRIASCGPWVRLRFRTGLWPQNTDGGYTVIGLRTGASVTVHYEVRVRPGPHMPRYDDPIHERDMIVACRNSLSLTPEPGTVPDWALVRGR